MSTLTIPNTFTANTLAQSALVNANFTAIANLINGNIDHSNTTSSTGFYASDIKPLTAGEAQFGATATGVGYKFLANDATAVPLTVAGVSGQSADLFDVTLTSGGTKVFSIASTGYASFVGNVTVGVGVLASAGTGTYSAPSPSPTSGDVVAQRSSSTGYTFTGGASDYILWGYDGANPRIQKYTSGGTLFIENSNGSGYMNVTGGTYTNSSEAKFKQNVEPITGALEMVLKLKPSSFEWIDGGQSDCGFIAQDVQAILPQLTRSNPAGLGIVYSGLTAFNTAAIQELAANFAAYIAAHP